VVPSVTRITRRRVRRSVTTVLLCAVTLAVFATPASAQRSRGNFFVYQSTNCTGLAERSNDSKVSVPFSVGGRNYPANIQLELFAVDLNTDPNDVFGPFVVTTDAEGRFCERVSQARTTHWKIDLVEPGSGFTDSKVIEVVAPTVPTTSLPGQATTTTTAITTTSLPGQTTTSAASTTTTSTTTSTTVPGQTTTTALPTTTTVSTTTTLPPPTATTAPTTTAPTTTAPTTTTATTTVPGQTTLPTSTTLPGQTPTTAAPGQTTTTAATTTVPGQTTTTMAGATTTRPEQDLGFEVEPVVPVPPEGVLPATGSSDTSELTAIAVGLLVAGGVAYFAVRRRRPERP
jgi:LPXTG-motif cell wall-anchored protein